jgi:predicted nucleic acid-binding protein
VREALRRLTKIRRSAIEVFPTEDLRNVAEIVLERVDVRAADSLQLAAAPVLAGGKPRDRGFVTFDGRLAEAAGSLGFIAMP